MTYSQIVIMVLVLAGGYAYRAWAMRKRARSFRSPELQEVMLRFFESTGYRFDERLREGPAAQAELWCRTNEDLLAKFKNAGVGGQQNSYRLVMRRTFDAMPIVWAAGYESGTPLNQWSIDLPQPVRIRWRAVTKAKAAGRPLVPMGFREIDPSDPQIDETLTILGTDAAGVRQLLLAPGVKEALLSLTHVDLWVDGNLVVFDDPMSKNTQAAMGGYLGTILAAGNMAAGMGMATPMHDQIADLMSRAARASA